LKVAAGSGVLIFALSILVLLAACSSLICFLTFSFSSSLASACFCFSVNSALLASTSFCNLAKVSASFCSLSLVLQHL
jgi:hypothetical protein